MTTLQELDFLLPDYQYVDGKKIVLTAGVRAAFYFWNGHSEKIRSALVECVEAYEAAYGEALAWAFNPDTAKPMPYKKMPPLRKLVQGMDQDDQIEWYAASGDFESANEYRITSLSERGWQEKRISQVCFTLPRDHAYVPEKRKKLFDLIRLFAEKLSPFHGHVGLGAIGVHQHYRYQPDEFDVATRYRGLYIADVTHANSAPEGLTSIDWFTYVSTTLAERCGGIENLEQRLRSAGADVKMMNEGLFVAYGEEPDIGPVAEPIAPTISAVNAILRPLRLGNVQLAFGSINGEIRFTPYTSDLWVRRYDAAGIWPPASVIGLPSEPSTAIAQPLVELKSGKPCKTGGRYRDLSKFDPDLEDEDMPTIFLLPGDIAPYWLKLGPHGKYLGRESVTWTLIAE